MNVYEQNYEDTGKDAWRFLLRQMVNFVHIFGTNFRYKFWKTEVVKQNMPKTTAC